MIRWLFCLNSAWKDAVDEPLDLEVDLPEKDFP